jgi:hypothetical protein
MMLFDPKVGPASKRGMWQEGREGEQRLMSATVKQRKTRVGECYLGRDQRRITSPQKLKWPVKQHVAMYGQAVLPTPIPVTCSKWHTRKAPFVHSAQPLDMSPLSCCQPA